MFEITKNQSNKDIPEGMNAAQAAEHYRAMTIGFQPKLTGPVISAHGDKWVFRGDKCTTSLKGFGAEPLIAACKERTLVYCAPRAGMAPDAVATLGHLYAKRCVFFCPASAEPSPHQRALLGYRAELRFIKIAAMPTLNIFAEKWAKQNGAKFLPFGLSKSPLVTAGIIRLADIITKQIGHEPSQVWMSVSTGTAIRAFQLAWPNAEIRGVVVARNMKDGEIGRAKLWSSAVPFLKDAKKSELPPFPSTNNYDAKCWSDFQEFGKSGSIFINVGADEKVFKMAKMFEGVKIDSQREWGDMRDLERGL